ncbi:MAG: hypothetical protein QOJ84_4874 [Bradyrhizobium sp.]|nr:hypothetical protein [Bradyrhizobium sp.]
MALIFMLFALCWYIFFRAQDIGRPGGSLEIFQELQIAKTFQDAIVKANERELNGAIEQLKVGQRAIVDVMDPQQRFSDAKTKLYLYQEKERLMIDAGYFSEVEAVKSKEELAAQLKGLTEYRAAIIAYQNQIKDGLKVGEVDNTDVAQAEVYVSDAEFKIRIVEQKLSVAPSALQLSNASSKLDTIELVRTSLIRFGGVAVTLFLMSVLVPIYRYNVRLGTFYLARADTLILCRDSHVNNFGELLNLLTPTLAFDREPKTPVDSVASIVKDAANIARRV